MKLILNSSEYIIYRLEYLGLLQERKVKMWFKMGGKQTMNLKTVLLVIYLGTVGGVRISIQADSANTSYPLHWRGNASNKKTIWLHDNQELNFNLCVIRDTYVTVTDVRYSNDGGSDVSNVLINGDVIGNFTSVAGSNHGHNWNVFRSSNQIGNPVQLLAGWNHAKLRVIAADTFGIEVDNLEFSVADDEMNEDIFSCTEPCLSAADLPTVSAATYGLTGGTAVQKSYPTQCAEEDNVNVALFNAGVEKYEIKATSPIYHTTRNNRDKNTHNCPFLTPVYWLYENVDVSPNTKTLSSNNSYLYFGEKPAPHHYFITKMAVSFTLEGRSKGHIDSEIGSTLYMTLLSPISPSDVTVSYTHRNGSSITFNPVSFFGSNNSSVWNIPDFTWREDKTNHISITVFSRSTNQLMTNFRLERRYMAPDQVYELYKSNDVILEAVRSDFWWRAPENITLIRPSTGDEWYDVAYFRFYVRDVGTDNFNQVFVMYQDGNVRLLNTPPSNFDWIPFGTSVIIGQTDVDSFRPAVSIATVEIEPDVMAMRVIYADGSSARMNVTTTQTETKLSVYDLDFRKNSTIHPFATLRSMYVAAGNCDSDSLVSDASPDSRRILGGNWTEVSGTTFMIYRRCQSKHLTQSPDITVTVLET